MLKEIEIFKKAQRMSCTPCDSNAIIIVLKSAPHAIL